MPPVIYGDGSLYGDADAIYGRISSALAAAQSSNVRSTGLKVTVIDEHLNDWSLINNTGAISTTFFYKTESISRGGDYNNLTHPKYWAYRGGSDVIKLPDGTVVRARIGSPGDFEDFKLYIQEITDPTDAGQWQSWTQLYSGTHYAVCLVPTGASTYDVYHIKDGSGFCKNNSSLVAAADDGVSLSKGFRIEPVKTEDGRLDDFFLVTVLGEYTLDGRRILDLYVVDPVTPGAYSSSDNMKWFRNTVSVIENPADENEWFYFRSFPHHQDPRTRDNGESITVSRSPSYEPDSLVYPPQLIRGLAGKGGFNILNLMDVHYSSDGYYYLFFGEFHTDDDYNAVQNASFNFWMRSKDAIHWSEPVLIGAALNGFAGAFEHDGYMYLCGNGQVLRRPMTAEEFAIENYVPSVNFDLPRSNEEGSGTISVANPGKVNDYLLELSDRRVIVEPGIKTADGTYEFKQVADLWIKKAKASGDAAASRIELAVGDVWSRLSTQLRDTFNIVGQTVWDDWMDGGHNEMFNYYFDGEAEVSGTDLILNGGLMLWTGWKGHNPNFAFRFNTAPITFYARYADEDNHWKFVYESGDVKFYNVRNGTETLISTHAVGSTQRLRIMIKWGWVFIYKDNGTLVASISTAQGPDDGDCALKPGYVGISASGERRIWDFYFRDWEEEVTTHDLVKFALAMGDYHDVVVGGPNNPQYALIWGPQTDLPTVADGLRQVLEAEKLELIWRDGFIEVGQFKDQTPVRTIRDELIENSFSEEAARRINLSIVDGNEHTWFEADAADTQKRGRQIVGYFDLPELMTQQAVKERAQEEIRRGKKGESPGGRIPLFFDIDRMSALNWVDNLGREYQVRVEGIRYELNQSKNPKQNMILDNSLL